MRAIAAPEARRCKPKDAVPKDAVPKDAVPKDAGPATLASTVAILKIGTQTGSSTHWSVLVELIRPT